MRDNPLFDEGGRETRDSPFRRSLQRVSTTRQSEAGGSDASDFAPLAFGSLRWAIDGLSPCPVDNIIDLSGRWQENLFWPWCPPSCVFLQRSKAAAKYNGTENVKRMRPGRTWCPKEYPARITRREEAAPTAARGVGGASLPRRFPRAYARWRPGRVSSITWRERYNAHIKKSGWRSVGSHRFSLNG